MFLPKFNIIIFGYFLTEQTPNTMSKKLLISSLAILLIAGSAFAIYKFKFQTETQSTQNTASVKVRKGDIENLVTAMGTIQPRDYVDVGAQVSGQLKSLLVEVGDVVHENQLLAEIDPEVFIAKVDATRAQLRYQRAQLTDREAQLVLAETNFKREKNLFAKQATTEENLLNAEASLKSAKAQIEMINAQISQTESSLRAEEANLGYAQIFAPMSGTVMSISAKRGQTLNANQQAPVILQIADLTTMTVKTEVSEADVSKLKVGMDVYFTTLGGGDKRWYGKLKQVEPTPTVTNNVVLYNALFDIPNPKKQLMSQMTAQVFFVIDSAKDVLLVPVSALAFQGRPNKDGTRNASVKILQADGKTQERQVKVGTANRVDAVILEGLAEGEEVLMFNSQPATRSGSRPGMGMRLG